MLFGTGSFMARTAAQSSSSPEPTDWDCCAVRRTSPTASHWLSRHPYKLRTDAGAPSICKRLDTFVRSLMFVCF